MIKYAAENEHLEDTIAKSEKMHKRYQELASKFDFEAYVPLIPWTRKKTMKVLETMDELISSELVHLYGDYRFCFDLRFINIKKAIKKNIRHSTSFNIIKNSRRR